MTNIALIGCTGSIGRQVCAVVRRYPDRFRFSALVGGRNAAGVSALAEEFRPDFAAVAEGGSLSLPDGVAKLCGEEILARCFDGCDVAMIAAGGFAGLAYTLRAAESGKKIALANKESLVCGGDLVMREVDRRGIDLIPVDSEHSALWQALSFRRDAPFEKLVLTASGGPFRSLSVEEMARVTAADALRHPTWNMGAKITVDSATLLNKGYEVIEAKWLYRAEFSQIEAVVHPESIVHSLVTFRDGATVAQMGYPTMELPIQLALTYPERLPCEKPLDFRSLGALHFFPLPAEKFPCFGLAVEAGKAGGTLPTVLNAAGEEAVKAFLRGSISFPKIAETISDALEAFPREEVSSYAQLAETDGKARLTARKFIYG
ncbi:MAG: 1-deoxy-D-xylulose-5-phosphate reductoisomerase [Candidatus Gallimonas sp.]